MPFAFVDHTADIAVHLWGRSLDELFESGARALVETLTDPARVRPGTRERLDLAGADLDVLLVDWLSELLYRFDARAYLPATVAVAVAGGAAEGWRLEAVLDGETLDRDRHPVKVLVKAVTYHGLAVARTAAGWDATVVFDV